MFKKTLLAAALTAATFGANATTVITTGTPGEEIISTQGLPATNAFQLVDSIILTLDADENSGIVDSGRLVVSITGAFWSNPTSAQAAVAGDIAGATATVDAAASTSTQLIFDLADAGGDLSAVADGDTITLTNLELQITGTTVSVSSVFQSGTNVDFASTAGAAIDVAKTGDQWVASVTAKLDQQIDVGNDRQTFVGGVTTDSLTFDVNTVGTGATLNDVTTTIAGDFKNILSVVATNNGAATYVINEALTEATYTYTGATDTTATEVTSNPSVVAFNLVTAADDVEAMDVSSFNASIDIDYDNAEAVQGDFSPLTSADAGGFELNGSTATLEYVPFGPNTALIIQATSTFDEDALVSVSYLNPTTGLMVDLENIATATASSVSRLGSIISAAIVADAGVESGKTRMVITVNAPAADVTFFTGFKDTSDKDRLALPQV